MYSKNNATPKFNFYWNLSSLGDDETKNENTLYISNSYCLVSKYNEWNLLWKLPYNID